MNPSVEESKDEARTGAPPPESSAENRQLSWSKTKQICSQHDAVLSSHLKMLHSAKDCALPDGESSTAIASMFERTEKLVSQFRVLKKQMASSESLGIIPRDNGSENMPHNDNTVNATTSHLTARKRQRLSQATAEGVAVGLGPEKTHEGRSHKRKRLDLIPQDNNDEDKNNEAPEFAETEDISDEVQRRLEIKEEQRRRRNVGSGKRKRDRDSLTPIESISSLGSSGRPKKRRIETGTTDAAVD